MRRSCKKPPEGAEPRAAFAILRFYKNTEAIHELPTSDHRARRLAVYRHRGRCCLTGSRFRGVRLCLDLLADPDLRRAVLPRPGAPNSDSGECRAVSR